MTKYFWRFFRQERRSTTDTVCFNLFNSSSLVLKIEFATVSRITDVAKEGSQDLVLRKAEKTYLFLGQRRVTEITDVI